MSGAARGNVQLVSTAAPGLTAPEVVMPAVWTSGPGRLLLDALPAMTVIVDHRGDIVAANEAWRRFGRENGARPAVAEGVGQNYFEICRDAALSR